MRMKCTLMHACLLAGLSLTASAAPLGLPPVPIPADNPQTPAKIALGDKLFHDTRFSSDGTVSCATCHDATKAFTDNLPVSKGVRGLTGTRSAPTVINAAYMESQFWDGRRADLEGQSKEPPVNPVEGGLADHNALLEIVRADPAYRDAFKKVFDVESQQISMDHVARAIASFERTVIAGNSAFDRYRYGGDRSAMNEAQIRGLAVFVGKGRCVSCHVIEQTQALFTDSRFHNIGVGFKRIRGKEMAVAQEFLKSKREGVEIDHAVLTNENMSELGRFAVTENVTEIGAFKTPTLRNVALTAPYMHDGSEDTLEKVVDFYNNGGRTNPDDPLSDFQSGGIRPLDLTDQEKSDLVEFMKALTSPEIEERVKQKIAVKEPENE